MDWIVEYLRSELDLALTLAAVCGAISFAAFWKLLADLRRRTTQKCRWTRDRIQPHAGATRWVCTACGGYGFSKGRHEPLACRKYEPKQVL